MSGKFVCLEKIRRTVAKCLNIPNRFIYPDKWEKITAKYPFKFEIWTIRDKVGDKWFWSGSPDSADDVDITFWKLRWLHEGHEILATLDEYFDIESQRIQNIGK
jgi:hypothetical protein